jgi:ribosomal protein S18 acetylase RimI-like enzyme
VSFPDIPIPQAPSIPGLRFRAFAGEGDYPAMAVVMNALAEHEGVTAMWNIYTLMHMDQWIRDFDPSRNRVMVEIDGKVVGMGRVECGHESSGKRVYMHSCNLLPEWRGKGIERSMLLHNEARLREIAATHPQDGPRFFQAFALPRTNPEAIVNVIALGYEPIRHSYHMVRPDLQNIPDAPLPPGITSRPMAEHEMRQIWDAGNEAFRDHWGHMDPPADGFETWKNCEDLDRTLSRVAWDGDQVVGRVLIYIPSAHNERAAKKRADTESICVGRPWRKRGVATALIAQCLHGLRGAGFHEAALGVDTENTSGALRIYERMGYKVVQKYSRYQKAMD